MLSLPFLESTALTLPIRVRLSGVGLEFMENEVFQYEILIDALVAIFGIYGVDFPP